ncbi:MAG TPA: SDR family oxidoreductase [Thermoflexia bacterium]|jgi:NAD(P)-dependent dehydrogenase (short-subunit alcohol dehydrogenase family)|nr:SDR family oxidoreductase [Thermoflexia bacterium]
MDPEYLNEWFDLRGRVAVVTGGTGGLLRATVKALARCGVAVVLLARNVERARRLARELEGEGGRALALQADVTDRERLEAVAAEVDRVLGRVDFLINGAGGNRPEATTGADRSFFDLPVEAIRGVLDLNFTGALLCSQVFGRRMAEQREGVILNISSMAALRPLTRIPAYSAAKAALTNFTQWLAVHMAQEYSPRIRVNAIAPGFFLTEQNRYLLVDEATGDWTPRGKTILAHTPMGRFGEPEDVVGTVMWLLSPGATFVTGVVVPVDGGFSAFGGV